ncbi:Killing trait domain-containing protein [Tistlia consotensis]|uniref:Killing trait domain-containing protein n=1 Tax=Tistlia consotensis USBA 355 TaxID=560819 RepID=A0A1Y6BGC2_9PROT|nr:RebB family R body protein [Tistlia consotensis]SMF09944.1 Killing trait domain-containing protein [Tistlia consotensis USBA 355]SNR34132.1 Killing trait domain-containing protein [Tistlia consotensis]
MADNTPVNSQITDAVTQTNVKVLGEAPAQAMGMVYQTMAHSISLAMQNSMQTQGGLQQIGNAVTSTACRLILDIANGGMGGGGGGGGGTGGG